MHQDHPGHSASVKTNRRRRPNISYLIGLSDTQILNSCAQTNDLYIRDYDFRMKVNAVMAEAISPDIAPSNKPKSPGNGPTNDKLD